MLARRLRIAFAHSFLPVSLALCTLQARASEAGTPVPESVCVATERAPSAQTLASPPLDLALRTLHPKHKSYLRLLEELKIYENEWLFLYFGPVAELNLAPRDLSV